MNINKFIKNNIEINFDKSILDLELNSDENEIFLNNNSYNIGCDICGLGYTLPFTTNIFDFINNKCKNIHDLKITNQTECSDNNLILEDYYICTNKDYFKKLENI